MGVFDGPLNPPEPKPYDDEASAYGFRFRVTGRHDGPEVECIEPDSDATLHDLTESPKGLNDPMLNMMLAELDRKIQAIGDYLAERHAGQIASTLD